MDADVVIAGAGPNGLMLACELGLAGIRPIVLERLPQRSDEPKANGLLGQVVSMVERRGLYESLTGSTEPPHPAPYFAFAAMGLDLTILDENPVYTLPVPQPRLVQVLEARAGVLGAEIRPGHELVGLSQHDDQVVLDIEGPSGRYQLSARYLVGADGAHSRTRKLSGIEFPGVSYDRTTSRWAHVHVPSTWVDPASGGVAVPGHGIVRPFIGHRTERGGFTYAPLPGKPPMIATTEWDQPACGEPMSLAELRDSVHRVLGVDVPFDPPSGEGPHLLRRLIGGNNRLAERFRDRRVFLLGDAAHVDAAGGQGLNLGMQDAVNLGWKLAAQLRSHAPANLLDTYDPERRRAGRRVSTYAQALSALLAPGSDVTALRELFSELLTDRSTVQRLADLTAGSDLRYDMGDDAGHPLVGRFAPDMRLDTSAGTTRLAQLARTAKPLLLDLTEAASVAQAVAEWHEQLDIITARGDTERLGATTVFLRPDCYIAWASTSPDPDATERDGLRAALRRWIGTPRPERAREAARACV